MKVPRFWVALSLAVFAQGAFASGGYGSFGGRTYPPSVYSTPRSSMPSYGSGSNPYSTGVQGYSRNNGTYVAPHQRSMPDNSLNNNWSTKGNTNPYTGTPGTKRGNPFGW
ncbi:hypothetical protein CAL28_10950 [Bordetella genomosp. 11]|uniref:Uncharacterized protein n=1 Tax=Bordetella genomosp. 11 TaxID=1416808 RepID=A0A261UFL8_9BORD|nr:hypothetical protein CAL28_10950 [Bordetella genomosp. 11]